MERTACTLPGGYVDAAGAVHRRAELVPLSGRDEALVSDAGPRPAPALISELLSHAVRRLGEIAPLPEPAARRLLVADRDYLLLRLRQATFGDRVESTLRCPGEGCGEKIDVAFSIAGFAVRESRDKGPTYRMELSPAAAVATGDGDRHREIRFRLPTGADQELYAPLFRQRPQRAVSALLRHLVVAIGPVDEPGEELLARLGAEACAEIEGAMEAVAPDVDLALDIACPECAHAFTLPFDLQGFLLAELGSHRGLLLREVHYLAFHYHWSEREILEMPRDKRRRYIEVLADEIERMSHAV